MTTIQRTIDSEPDDWQKNIQELSVRIFVCSISSHNQSFSLGISVSQ